MPSYGPSNPLTALKSAWDWGNKSLIPQGTVQGAQDAIDSPSLNRSPMEARLRGFGAGALGGAANQISPVGIASVLPMGRMANLGGKALGAMERAPEAFQGLANVTPDLVQAAHVRQVAPTMQDADAIAGLIKHGAAKIPSSKAVQAAQAAERGPKFYDPAADINRLKDEHLLQEQASRARMRGTPADRPSTPQGQQLEHRRRALDALTQTR